MAVYDRDNAKLVVRVVYDGPGNAGKTTNLAEMCQFFTARRRSELISPEALAGRTMWFDWLQIDAGLVGGFALRCQIVTVPGQLVLRRRRSVLLRAADVVVMVCDSTPPGLELVRAAFGRIRQFTAEQSGSDVPIVVQANKQDLPGALSPEEVAAALGADATVPVVGARANAGIGVKETLVLAIRAAANRAQQQVLERGIDALAGEPGDAEAVLRELRQLDDAPGSALDDLLGQPVFVEPPPPVRMPPIPPPPVRAVEPAVPVAPPVEAAVAPPVAPPAWWPVPPLGDASITPGNLWPAATGRDALRGLTGMELRPRFDLVAQLGDRDGSGKASTVLYDADGWFIKTSTDRRFDDLDASRVALVKLARTKIALGTLTLPNTVLVTCGDPDQGYWVWTFAPWRQTLRGAMTEAIAAGDRAGIGDALVQFAGAVGEALVRALRTGQGLDLHPSNFALDGDTLVYLDDEVSEAPPVRGAAHAILQRAEELAGSPDEIDRYAATLIEELSARLTADDIARLGLVEDLQTTVPRAGLARALQARLLAAFDPAPERSRAAREVEAAPAPSAPTVELPAVWAPPPRAELEAVALAAPPIDESIEPEPEFEPEPEPEPAPVRMPVAAPSDAWPAPPTAAEHLPSGFIWPVVAGRELVRQILGRTPTRRDGRPFTYDLGDYTLSTSSERRFIEVDDARAELLRLARAQVARGAAQPRVVLVLAPDDTRGGHWIWTIAPSAVDAMAAP